MPEGLDPIETGKKLHEHGEAHNKQSEGKDGQGSSEERHSRIIQISEAVLLSIVTITAAWAGYSAARWGHGLTGGYRPVLRAAQHRYPR
jgi:hypothetical protein